METVILISVLSTLGVVAVVSSVVVMFNKLNGKVDRQSYEKHIDYLQTQLDNVINEFSIKIDDTNNNLKREMEGNFNSLEGRIEESFRFTDSRCDKLHQELVTKSS